MEETDLTSKIAGILRECGDAHHEFEQNELQGKRDESWPAWYAKYLLEHGMDELFEEQVSPADLESTLLEAAGSFEGIKDDTRTWDQYYAQAITEQFT
ncbi:MAG: hypothetical protein TR69_WS6001001109 [candidate division WS6 bacterium OLB20]|uniref:Uncharacterized protein n=1 Tax=candidate division WS6 bacterium OLB20 TaxID=1617426 RepID=A0A136LZL4_9BACT|nr:MAG: hypothetical protein TR69_WS6001001109 [candidate division WS6 bacterium OLB20]